MYDIPYMWNLRRNNTNELIYKTETFTDLKNKLKVTMREQWGQGIVRECWTNMYTLLYLKWITNKVLLDSTGNSVQCYVAAWWERNLWENGDTYIYGWVPLLSTQNYHNNVNRLQSKRKGKSLRTTKKQSATVLGIISTPVNPLTKIMQGFLLWNVSIYNMVDSKTFATI